MILSSWTASAAENTGRSSASDPGFEVELRRHFETTVYPLLERGGESGCVGCHDAGVRSDLKLHGNARDDFHLLLRGGYLGGDGPDTLIGRVTASDPDRRMPKNAEPWGGDDVGVLRELIAQIPPTDSNVSDHGDGAGPWPLFPTDLLTRFTGPTPKPGPDPGPFLSFRQLKGKVAVLFGDDGRRGERDLFAENLALLGGADFKTRFNESTEPSSSFLSGLDAIAREVCERAWRHRTGPFSGFPDPAPFPVDPDPDSDSDSADAVGVPGSDRSAGSDRGSRSAGDLETAITGLYRAILYRTPTLTEIDDAATLLRRVAAEREWIEDRNDVAEFVLNVRDAATGWQSEKRFRLPVSGDRLAVRQYWIDQASGEPAGGGDGPLMAVELAEPFQLDADETRQRFELHNVGSAGNVSFAGIELRPADSANATVRLSANDPRVKAEGAWKPNRAGGVFSYEDQDVEKGNSWIRAPIEVSVSGEYRIAVLWRKGRNTPNALVEVHTPAGGPADRIANRNPDNPPAAGSAEFHYDCSEDTLPFVELPVPFILEEGDGVRVSNRGTTRRVTIAGVGFVPVTGGDEIRVDASNAEGSEDWKEFESGRFRAYNAKGTLLHDDNSRKGELALRFHPGAGSAEWIPGSAFRIRIYYPGKANQETRVPVTVTAERSGPVILAAAPVRARAGTAIRLDAGATYTAHGGDLEFEWRQESGVPAAIGETTGAVFEASLRRREVRGTAWIALARSLMKHPDFLFTRPPSLLRAKDPIERNRLRAVKLALDLVGRPPTPDEVRSIERGQSLRWLTDRYLASEEFREFYFHRIRLYLESQGTPEQDEPARLWCHVVFNDLPFQEILTADYTVDTEFQPVSRPKVHGRSGLLTTRGFIAGKPGLPHYNYAAQVSMLFLGYVYEVPPEIVEQREGITALGTTDPNSACYSCHKILTPLAMQRSFWTDDGNYRRRDENGREIDASDRNLVAEYPFKGTGMEAFATRAVQTERFIRTMINLHYQFFMGRTMRHRTDERLLYKELWGHVHSKGFRVKDLIRAIVATPEYWIEQKEQTP